MDKKTYIGSEYIMLGVEQIGTGISMYAQYYNNAMASSHCSPKATDRYRRGVQCFRGESNGNIK